MASKYIPSCSGSRLLVAAQKTVGLPGLISRGTARNLPSWQETAWPLPKSLITRPSEVVLPTASSAGAAATTRQASQEGKSGTGTEERGAAAPVGSTDGACPAHGGACRSSANGGSTRSIDAGPNLLAEMLMMSAPRWCCSTKPGRQISRKPTPQLTSTWSPALKPPTVKTETGVAAVGAAPGPYSTVVWGRGGVGVGGDR